MKNVYKDPTYLRPTNNRYSQLINAWKAGGLFDEADNLLVAIKWLLRDSTYPTHHTSPLLFL